MNIKNLGLTVVVGALLLGGAGVASGTTTTPPPPPKTVELGPQDGAQNTVIAFGFGTKNAVTKREYTELAVPCRLYDSRKSSALPVGTFRTIPLTACTGSRRMRPR